MTSDDSELIFTCYIYKYMYIFFIKRHCGKRSLPFSKSQNQPFDNLRKELHSFSGSKNSSLARFIFLANHCWWGQYFLPFTYFQAIINLPSNPFNLPSLWSVVHKAPMRPLPSAPIFSNWTQLLSCIHLWESLFLQNLCHYVFLGLVTFIFTTDTMLGLRNSGTSFVNKVTTSTIYSSPSLRQTVTFISTSWLNYHNNPN